MAGAIYINSYGKIATVNTLLHVFLGMPQNQIRMSQLVIKSSFVERV